MQIPEYQDEYPMLEFFQIHIFYIISIHRTSCALSAS